MYHATPNPDSEEKIFLRRSKLAKTISLCCSGKGLWPILTSILKDAGYSLSPIRGISALEKRLSSGAMGDMAVVDNDFDNSDDLRIVRKIRNTFINLPILVLFRFPNAPPGDIPNLESYILKTLEAGATDYLTFPFHQGHFSGRVQAIFRSVELSQEGQEYLARLNAADKLLLLAGRVQTITNHLLLLRVNSASEIDRRVKFSLFGVARISSTIGNLKNRATPRARREWCKQIATYLRERLRCNRLYTRR